MRHAPADVGRVAVEATAHVIVDAAPGHRFQRLHHHAERRGIARAAVVAEQELELERPGKPGRAPEAAVRRVERPPELGEGAPEDVGAWHLLARRGGHLLADAAREVGGRGSRPVGVLGVDRVHPPEEREEAEAHPAVAVARGEIGATVERLPVRREPHGHRPAAVPRHHLDGGHVDGVDVGPSLAIDLDGDVVLVQLGGDLLVVERLLLHHVAPVARRVADAQENRPVLAPRAFERLLTPGVPVDGVVRVLEEIRAVLQDQPVGVLGRAVGIPVARAGLVAGALRRERLPERRREHRRMGRRARERRGGRARGQVPESGERQRDRHHDGRANGTRVAHLPS